MIRKDFFINRIGAIWALLFACTLTPFSLIAKVEVNNEVSSVRRGITGLDYTPDSLGNKIPDYSFCGYGASNKSIPVIPVKVVVPAVDSDATTAIQKAIDYVSSLPMQENGFRGAILLKEGVYNVNGRFKLNSSGIVIRGSGKKTILKATGDDRETLIRVVGGAEKKVKDTVAITSDYVPVGATRLQVDDTSVFHTGMQVFVERLSTQEWIDEIGMNNFGGDTDWLGWKPGRRDITWERTITKIKGDTLFLDVPLTTAIEKRLGGGTVSSFSWSERISNIGIENLALESDYDTSNDKDEAHCWSAVTMENVTNAWVRQVSFLHFAGSAVALYETASKVTVEDCISTDPVSEIAGERRNTFFTMGQQTLFLCCYSEYGRHDFATGFMAAGPNAFVQCEAVLPNDFSGAIDSWASGVLFDIVTVDGDALSFKNRGQDGKGAGWTAANSMFWQCAASRIECFAPVGAQNWAYGAWSQFAGNGSWYEPNSHIRLRSLFFAQLADRLGKSLDDYKHELLPFEGESTSSPTIEQAAGFITKAQEPPVQLKDYILDASSRTPISVEADGAISVSDGNMDVEVVTPEKKHISLKNGWLVFNDRPIVGARFDEPWWSGDSRPYAVKKMKPAVTRYVPGRVGLGYTDNLEEVVASMEKMGVAALDHNYGLWYDRRRDDHERIRRFDAEVWPPFYEQPFARSGRGEAWDRLSKYDLTKPNTWYWNRLSDFAKLAEQKGKILIHQNYFQHNILEAGAHWADSPWRPANNINKTGFPEPPPYAGDKRIYMAEQFYDTTQVVRNKLHREYIRQCLENFRGMSNVIQCTSAEYTGPLHFMQFWLDVIDEWEKETGEKELIALSATKDVQDSILADSLRSKVIDVIDIRYWGYRAEGTTYEPPGGANLAPRQHARKVKTGSRSFESVYKAVAEYRTKFPDKAVIYSEGNYTRLGWAVFMGGGSMPVLPESVNQGLLESAANMLPFSTDEEKVYGLKDGQDGMILYCKVDKSVRVDLSGYHGKFNVCFVKPSTGEKMDCKKQLTGGRRTKVNFPFEGDVIVWVKKKNS